MTRAEVIATLAWITDAVIHTRVPDTERGDFVLYHRTTLDAAKAILLGGFRDASGFYMIPKETSGVWLSDVPVDANEGAKGHVLLRLHFCGALSGLDQYEWVEDGFCKNYREWQIPAARLNGARIEVVDEYSDG